MLVVVTEAPSLRVVVILGFKCRLGPENSRSSKPERLEISKGPSGFFLKRFRTLLHRFLDPLGEWWSSPWMSMKEELRCTTCRRRDSCSLEPLA